MKFVKWICFGGYFTNRNVIFWGLFMLAGVSILGERAGHAQEFAHLLEDFEESFINTSGYGFIPPDWSVSGPQVTTFSQGSESHHDQFSLHANATYDDNNYTFLDIVYQGQAGVTVDLGLYVKATTDEQAEARFALDDPSGQINSTTLFWYDYSSSDWRTMILNDVVIPANGEVSLKLGVKHNAVNGSTDFDFDCLTSDTSLSLPTPPGDTNDGDDEGGGGGDGGCFLTMLKF